jgi:hypothetical protein
MNMARKGNHFSMKRISALLVILAAFIAGCSSTVLLPGEWNKSRIAIDGDDRDWQNGNTWLLDDVTSIGVRNDSQFIFIMFKSVKPGIASQVLHGGLTVWFDPKGGDGKTFGLRFPVREDRNAGAGRRGNSSSDKNGEIPRPRAGQNPPPLSGKNAPPPSGDNPSGQHGEYPSSHGEDFPPMDGPDRTPKYFELLNNEDEGGVRMSFSEAQGLLLNMNRQESALIFELQVPLHSNKIFPFGIDVADSVIGVGFESGRMEQTRKPEGMSDSEGDRRGSGGAGGTGAGIPGGGGMPGGGGGYGGHLPRGGDAGESASSSSIKQWMQVRLAKQ